MNVENPPAYQTTERHFQIFRNTFLDLVKRFGFTEWNVTFEWLDNQDPEDGDEEDRTWWIAGITANPDHWRAHVEFYKTWLGQKPSDDAARRCAAHEFFHLLTKRLEQLGRDRWSKPEDFENEFEFIARKFEYAMFPVKR